MCEKLSSFFQNISTPQIFYQDLWAKVKYINRKWYHKNSLPLISHDRKTLRKCKEEGCYCCSRRSMNKYKHTFLCSYSNVSVSAASFGYHRFWQWWLVIVRYFSFQQLPEEIQRTEFGCRMCLAIPDRARPASGYRARSQMVVCVLNHFLFTFQSLCVTGSFESFVTAHVASCNTEVLNIPAE